MSPSLFYRNIFLGNTEIFFGRISLELLNQGMKANCASYPKVNLGLGFKNRTKEDSYLKPATPSCLVFRWKFYSLKVP